MLWMLEVTEGEKADQHREREEYRNDMGTFRLRYAAFVSGASGRGFSSW